MWGNLTQSSGFSTRGVRVPGGFCWRRSLCTRSLLSDSSEPGGREYLETLTKGATCMSRCPSASCIPSWVSARDPRLWCPASPRVQKRNLRALALRFASLVGDTLWVYSWEECCEVVCPDPFSPRPEKGSQAGRLWREGPLWREEPQASRVCWSPRPCPLHPWEHPSHQGEDSKGKGPPFL